MKRLLALVLCLVMIVCLAACGHEHTWLEATCTTAKTCSECGETEGEPLGHTWVDATCEKPKTCSVCGATEGEPNGHVWEEANCLHPEQCAVCGSTKNSTLGDHVCTAWSEMVEPTCTEAGYKKGTCINCGQEFTVVQEKVPHNFGEWEVTKETSCAETGEQKHVCVDCGFEETEEIPLLEHDLDEWKIAKEAVYNENGVKEQKCLACKNVINTEEFTFADTVKDKVVFKGDADEVLTTDARAIYKNSWGYINGQAIVEITNNGSTNVKVTKVNLDLVDNDSALIHTINEYSIELAPAIIEPGQKGYILANFFEPADALDTSNGLDVKAYVTLEKTSDSRSKWEFTDLNTKGNDPETVGHITNADNVAYNGYRVYCMYRDVTGRVIGFTMAYGNNEIGPDETESFGANSYYNGLIRGSDVAEVECIGVGYK